MGRFDHSVLPFVEPEVGGLERYLFVVGIFLCELHDLEVKVLMLFQIEPQMGDLGVEVVWVLELLEHDVPVALSDAPVSEPAEEVVWRSLVHAQFPQETFPRGFRWV